MNKRNTIPFLQCIPPEKFAQVIQDIADYEKEYGRDFRPDLEERQSVTYDYQGEELEEIDREMRKFPSRSRG